MKHQRRLIYKEKNDFTDYGELSDYAKSIAEAITGKHHRISGGWNVLGVINEAFCQATTLMWDFSSCIYFEKDYFDESVKTMPLNVANAVYSVVFLLLRQSGGQKDVLRMIEDKLSTRPVFQSLKALQNSDEPLSFYPETEYFYNSDYVDWALFTDNFNPVCVQRVMDIAERYEHNIMTARGVYGQMRSYAVANNLLDAAVIVESTNILRSYLRLNLESEIFLGDEINESRVLAVPEIVEVSKDFDEKQRQLAEAQALQKELSAKLEVVRAERDQHYKESEEYKKAIADLKRDLGKSRISYSEIADRILNLPVADRYRVFSEVSTLLMGTEWTSKAEEVLQKILHANQTQVQSVNIGILNNYPGATFTDNSVSALPEVNGIQKQIEQ